MFGIEDSNGHNELLRRTTVCTMDNRKHFVGLLVVSLCNLKKRGLMGNGVSGPFPGVIYFVS